ncbi:hypothetical protein H0H92_009779 [Tricholoma furcatifolium]|nr:hypothetical protein H0H92_009779 [Tricholoma furcatifolium]
MNITWRGSAPEDQLKTDCENAVRAAAIAPYNTTMVFVSAIISGTDHVTTIDPSGLRIHDQRHITVNSKDAAQQTTHIPAHVYLQNSRPDFKIQGDVLWGEA